MHLKRILDRMLIGEFMQKKEINLKKSYAWHPGDTIVIGCSAGADSMALFDMLLKQKDEFSLSLICAHVNHHVRKESEEEQIFLENYCKQRGVIFETMTIDRYSDDNFHNEARAIRYRFFENVVKKYHANYLVTAHHADDLMETILMRLVRGSTLKGYSGFQKVVQKENYTLVRPLIGYTKQELFHYVTSHNIPYREDASNHKMNYTRNRYRKYVLPFLKEEDAKVHEKFLKFSHLLQDANGFIEKQVQKSLEEVYSDHQLNIETYLKLDLFLQDKILYSILEEIYQDDLILIDDQHVLLLKKLIESKRANARIYLPNEIVAQKNYQTIVFQLKVDQVSRYEIELNDYVYLPNKKHLELVSSEEGTGNDVCRLLSTDITLPLMVRTRKFGDRMSLKGTVGKKKLKSIFIDKKIPIQQRDLWPVVVDSSGEIVWLPGLQKTKFDKKKSESYDIIIKYH